MDLALALLLLLVGLAVAGGLACLAFRAVGKALWATVVALALVTAVLIDNATARLTRRRMVRFNLTYGIVLVALHLIWNLSITPGVRL